MTGIQASRTVYYTRRKATPTGRREIRKWARSAVWLAGFIAYTAWTARNGLIELAPDVWAEAYDQIAANNPGTQTARCAATAAAAIWAIIATASLTYIIRRRPWRPHSGGLHICSPVWNLPRPRTQPIPTPYFPPIGHHSPPLLPDLEETGPDPTPDPEPPQTTNPTTARPAPFRHQQRTRHRRRGR